MSSSHLLLTRQGAVTCAVHRGACQENYAARMQAAHARIRGAGARPAPKPQPAPRTPQLSLLEVA